MSDPVLPNQAQLFTSIATISNPAYPAWVHAYYQNSQHELWRKTYFTSHTEPTNVSLRSTYLHSDAIQSEYLESQGGDVPPKYYPLSLNCPLGTSLRKLLQHNPGLICLTGTPIPDENRSVCTVFEAWGFSPASAGGYQIDRIGMDLLPKHRQGHEGITELEVKGFNPGDPIIRHVPKTGATLEGSHLAAIADSVTTRIIIYQTNDALYEVVFTKSDNSGTWSDPSLVVARKDPNPPLRLAVTQVEKGVCLYYCHTSKVYRVVRVGGKWSEPKDVTPQADTATSATEAIRKTCLAATPKSGTKNTVYLFYQGKSGENKVLYLEDVIE